MPLSEESDPFARRHLPDQRRRNCAALERFRLELCRGKLCGRAGARRLPPISTTTAQGSPAARHHHAGREAKLEQQRTHRAACPGFFFCPSSRPAPAPALPRRRPDDDGGGLPDLPGLGGVGLPDEQRTARPITCPGCSFQPDPRRPDDPRRPAARTPARPTDNASRQPASTPPPAQRQRGQILHLTGYGFRLRA